MRKKFLEREYEVVDLKEIGCNEYAFDLVSAIAFLYEAASCGKRILGGDIIEKVGDHWSVSNDNWYSEKETPEETLDDALNYLRNYLDRNYKLYPWKVSIVIS